MNKYLTICILSLIFLSSCDVILQSLKDSNSPVLSQTEVANGLKEALKVGSSNTVGIVGRTNGYYSNANIKIPFPPEAKQVKDICESAGLKSQITQFEEKLNRAAEEAARGAIDVFVDAIAQMTISDAITILRSEDDAATKYLKQTTEKKLYTKFYPIVVSATEKIMLAKYWTPLVEKYNTVVSLTGGAKVNTDLNAYVTTKALDGLFFMLAKEEKEIRQNPVARINDILKKVFGSNLNPHNK